MSGRFTLTPEELGLNIEGRRLPVPVLTPKRKKTGGGFGFMPQKPADRFWVVDAYANADNIRPPLPEYAPFNSCEVPAIVSSIPCFFVGAGRDDVEELSRALYRWSPKQHGPQPAIYRRPDSKMPWCSTHLSDHSEGPIARRWLPNGDGSFSFHEVPCPGDRCEFVEAAGKDLQAPCLRKARIYLWPDWQTHAARIRADKSAKAADFAESIAKLPQGPLKLATGGQYAPSAVNFEIFLKWIDDQAKALGVENYNLTGFRFRVSVGRKQGARQYTVYRFRPEGDVGAWLSAQMDQRKRLADISERYAIGPGAAAEASEDIIGADCAEITREPAEGVASRPAHVADVAAPADPALTAEERKETEAAFLAHMSEIEMAAEHGPPSEWGPKELAVARALGLEE